MPSTEQTSTFRRADIQGLRGVAVLLVVAYHAEIIFHGGFIGVDVFFVISGYVITAMLLREIGQEGRVDFRRFYARRAARLLPALGLVTSVVTVAAAVLLSPFDQQQQTAELGLGATFYSANFVAALTFDYFRSAANPFLHMWSLSVEEQFYLVFPAVLTVGWAIGHRWKRGRAGAVTVLGLATGVSFAVSLALSYRLVPQLSEFLSGTFAFYLAPARAWEFGMGALVALWGSRAIGSRKRTSIALPGTSLALLIISALVLGGSRPFPGVVALVPVLATAGIIMGGFGGANPAGRLLATRPLVWIGDLSYSWYLWHWPAVFFAQQLWGGAQVVSVSAAVLSLLPSWLSLRFLENPIRHNQTVTLKRTLRIVGASVGVPTLLLAGLLVGSRTHWGSETLASTAAQILPYHLDVTAGCTGREPIGSRPEDECVWNGGASGPTVYLVGDSEAGQFSEAVVAAGQELGSPIVIGTNPGCPFILADLAKDGVAQDDCKGYVVRSVDWLAAQDPGVVVVASASDLWLGDPTSVVGGATASAPDQDAVWEGALTDTIVTLQAAGHEVIVIHPIPKVGGATSRGCLIFTAASDPGCYGTSSTRENSIRSRMAALSVERSTVLGTGVWSLDLFDDLCPGEVCTSNVGSTWIYRDPIHITIAQSERLTPQFRSILADALTALEN